MDQPSEGEVKRCHQCGRVGTRQFKPYPAQEIAGIDPARGGDAAVFIVEAGQWGWECTSKRACRRRWPKTRMRGE